jgi:hypothetical protein
MVSHEVPMKELNKDKAVALLNRILEHELAGVVDTRTIPCWCSGSTGSPSWPGCASRPPNP